MTRHRLAARCGSGRHGEPHRQKAAKGNGPLRPRRRRRRRHMGVRARVVHTLRASSVELRHSGLPSLGLCRTAATAAPTTEPARHAGESRQSAARERLVFRITCVECHVSHMLHVFRLLDVSCAACTHARTQAMCASGPRTARPRPSRPPRASRIH